MDKTLENSKKVALLIRPFIEQLDIIDENSILYLKEVVKDMRETSQSKLSASVLIADYSPSETEYEHKQIALLEKIIAVKQAHLDLIACAHKIAETEQHNKTLRKIFGGKG